MFVVVDGRTMGYGVPRRNHVANNNKKGKLYDRMSRSASRLTGQNVRGLNYPLYDFDLRATHARTLLPAALASVSFGFVLVRVRVLRYKCLSFILGAVHNALM